MTSGPASASDGKTSFVSGLLNKFQIKDATDKNLDLTVSQDFSYLADGKTSFELTKLADEFSLFLNPTLLMTQINVGLPDKSYFGPDQDGFRQLWISNKYMEAYYAIIIGDERAAICPFHRIFLTPVMGSHSKSILALHLRSSFKI
jgi:hypothetical protein